VFPTDGPAAAIDTPTVDNTIISAAALSTATTTATLTTATTSPVTVRTIQLQIIIIIIIIIIITTENSHIGLCTHTSESANVKEQKSQRRN